MSIGKYISADPSIQGGKLCFKGTRIPVFRVLELLEAGVREDQILTRFYPQLNQRSIRAALHCAAKTLEDRTFSPFASA